MPTATEDSMQCASLVGRATAERAQRVANALTASTKMHATLVFMASAADMYARTGR